MRKIEELKIEDVLRIHPVEGTSSSLNLRSAISKMRKGKFGFMLITNDEGEPEGVLTERDLVNKLPLTKTFCLKDLLIKDIMCKKLVGLRKDKTLLSALELMRKNRFRHLLIFNRENNICGVISAKDIIEIAIELLGHRAEEILNGKSKK